MIKKIIEGYGNLFQSTGKIITLLFACAALGAIFVFPLWKFATSAPKIYTIVVFTLIAAAVVFLCVKKILTSGVKTFLSSLSKVVVIIGGLSICIDLVLSGKRILAIPALVLMIVLYGIASFGFKKTIKSEK